MRRSLADLKSDCHAAVLAEVADTGLARLTVEGIARRAGVAKTSIYRHWPTVEELLLDALSHTFPAERPTPGGKNLRTDLLRSLDQLTAWLAGPTARAAAEILAERHRRPDLVDALYRRVFDAHGGRFTQTVLRLYAERREIDAGRVTPVVCDIGEAMVIKHQIDTGELPGKVYRTAIVDQVILPALGVQAPKEKTR